VASLCGNLHKISRLQATDLCVIGKPQLRAAAQQQHPFGLRLLIPEICRAGVAKRDNALDVQARLLQQGQELFLLGWLCRQLAEQIVDHAWLSARRRQLRRTLAPAGWRV
jgi:hypothetical protein